MGGRGRNAEGMRVSPSNDDGDDGDDVCICYVCVCMYMLCMCVCVCVCVSLVAVGECYVSPRVPRALFTTQNWKTVGRRAFQC